MYNQISIYKKMNRFFMLSLFTLSLFLFFIFIFIKYPSFMKERESVLEQKKLEFNLLLKNFEEFFNSLESKSYQIANRSVIRDALIKYNQGSMTIEELNLLSLSKLKDGLEYFPEAKGFVRCSDNGTPVLKIGLVIDPIFKVMPKDMNIVYGEVFFYEKEFYYTLGVPIKGGVNRNQKVGSDLYLISLSTIKKILLESKSKFEYGTFSLALKVDSQTFSDIFTPSKIYKFDTSVKKDYQDDGKSITILSPSFKIPNFYIVYKADKDLLFKDLDNFLITQLLFYLTLLVAAFILFFWASKRFKREVTKSLKDMELQTDEATSNLDNVKAEKTQILNFISSAVWILDKDGKISFVNQATEKIFGYKPDEMIGKDHCGFLKISDKEGPIPDKCTVCESVRSGKFFENIKRKIFTKDDKIIDFSISTSPIFQKGEIIGTILILNDISKSERLISDMKKLTEVINRMPSGVVITDKNGTIEYVNPSYERITKYSKDELIGKNPRIFKSFMQTNRFYENFWHTILSGSVWMGNFINNNKYKELVYEEATVIPVKNDSGEITNFIAIKHDVTDRKNISDKFNQIQKFESIGLLVGGISHDFNNILTIISGYNEMVLSSLKEDDTLKSYILKVNDGIDKMSQLVKHLSAFTRKQDYNPEVINISKEVKLIENMLRKLVSEDIKFYFKYKTQDSFIIADINNIQVILINLIKNASDAVNSRKDNFNREIDVIVDYLDIGDENVYNLDKGGYVVIAVRDTGIGIPESMINRIFDPFFTTKGVGENSGLGLSTVLGIVKQSGAYINVTSKVDEGSKFEILWPCYRKGIKSEIPSKTPLTSENNLPVCPTGRKKRVMVVDDEIELAEITKATLESVGYSVEISANPLSAMELLKKEDYKFDLVITDIIMPDINGKDFYEKVHLENDKIKFLFVSGYPVGVLEEKGFRIEEQNFLSKPLSTTKLSKKINEIFSDEKG